MGLVFVLVLVGLLLTNNAMAFTTSQLVPVSNGSYTSWLHNSYNKIDEGLSYPSCAMVSNVNDYIIENKNNDRSSFSINLSSIPNGSMITSVKVLSADRNVISGQDGGTYATFVRLNGVNSLNSIIHTTTSSSPFSSACNGLRDDIFDVTDTVKNNATTLEIGVIKLGSSAPANHTSLVGAMATIITYSDVTAPIITINNPNSNPARNKSISAITNEGILSKSVTLGSVCDDSLIFTNYLNKNTFSSESDNGKKICYKAVDASSNTTYKMSNAVTGIDNTAPTLNLPSDITIDTTNPMGEIVNFEATATDLNPANPVVTCFPQSGSTFRIGTRTVNCHTTDTLGNTASGSFTVTIYDVSPPPVYNATIRVCKAILDAEGNSISGPLNVVFAIPWENANYEGPATSFNMLPPLFFTPLPLETISEDIKGQCEDFSLASGRYYYGQEVHGIIGEWGAPLYNDQFDADTSSLSDFGEFNSDLNPEFNKYDGVIEVSPDETVTLVVLNHLISL